MDGSHRLFSRSVSTSLIFQSIQALRRCLPRPLAMLQRRLVEQVGELSHEGARHGGSGGRLHAADRVPARRRPFSWDAGIGVRN